MLDAVLPIQSVLMMVFFLSIGLLIDLGFMIDNIGMVLTLFLMVTVFKTLINVGFLRIAGQPWATAFLAGISMAQIGEFSFLLAVVGIGSGVLDEEGRRLIVSVTVLSLALSPLWVITARRLSLLANYGVTEATDLMRLVYGPETEAISQAMERASGRTQRTMRATALKIRRYRQRKRRRIWKAEAEADPAHVSGEADVAADAVIEAELIEPATVDIKVEAPSAPKALKQWKKPTAKKVGAEMKASKKTPARKTTKKPPPSDPPRDA